MFFLRYWQRNNKLFVLDNLGMPLTSKKNITFKKPETMISQQKLTSSFISFLRYCKDIVNLLLQVIWPCLAMYTQTDTINLQKTFGFIWRQKINFMLFRRCCKDMQTCFRYFEHASLYTTKLQYELAEDFNVYLHAKNKVHHSLLASDIF